MANLYTYSTISMRSASNQRHLLYSLLISEFDQEATAVRTTVNESNLWDKTITVTFNFCLTGHFSGLARSLKVNFWVMLEQDFLQTGYNSGRPTNIVKSSEG